VWWFSFAWEFVFGVNQYLIFLLILLFIGFVISVLIDKKYKTNLKTYYIISIVQLLFIWLIATPVREWQIKSSKDEGIQIAEQVESYKDKNDVYPISLAELENETNSNIPKRTIIGTKYIYELNENGNYYIRFKSYYGYDFHYDKVKKEWLTTD